MTEKPSENDERPDADAEFARVLGNLVNTPHKPHEKSPPTPGRKRGRPPKGAASLSDTPEYQAQLASVLAAQRQL